MDWFDYGNGCYLFAVSGLSASKTLLYMPGPYGFAAPAFLRCLLICNDFGIDIADKI